jgi:beta-glucanase (GH16 family)
MVATKILSKSDIGLGNVDNTSDLNKPVPSAVTTALAGKAPLSHTHNKAEVGLGNVDDTADVNKPVSIAQAAAISNASVLSGTGVPSNTIGVPKQFYVDTAASRLYGPKGATNWPATYFNLTAVVSQVVNSAPVNTAAPSVAGVYQTGQTLTAAVGAWTGVPDPTFAYQWMRGPAPTGNPDPNAPTQPLDPSTLTAIAGATANTYLTTSADIGFLLYVRVIATNSEGSATAYSAATGKIVAPPSLVPVNTFLPQVTGITQVGSTLTTSNGSWTNSPTSYTYQWRRNGVNISGATSATYVLVSADAGTAITVAVTATNASGASTAAISNPTNSIAVLADATTAPILVSPPVISGPGVEATTLTSFQASWIESLTAPSNTALPTITGAAAQGQTLTASTGSWDANPTPTYAYQWMANGANISGATANTYVLTSGELGKLITVAVTATNSAGVASATSPQRGPVAAPLATPTNTAVPVIVGTATEGQTLSVGGTGVSVIDPNDLAGTAVRTFNEDWDMLNLWNGTSGRWATGYHWYPPQGGSLNDEQQWYITNTYGPTQSVAPWTVSNGVLSITAAPTPSNLLSTVNNFAYTSGMLTTYRSFTQKYGYFEASLKLPKGQGFWPAFWLLPADGSWPPEIDIMENLGRDITHYYATTHWSSTNQQLGQYVATPDLSIAFHRFGVRWDATNLTYYFDGQQVAQHANQSDMNQPFYIILNLALGGQWGGNVDGTTPFPATLQCEYVRAYTPAASTPGTWTNNPTSYSYQWKRGGVAISGATASSYTLQSPDVGAVITVTVTATNGAGSASATSAGTSAVAASGATVNSNLLAHPTQLASSDGFWSSGGDAPLATAATSTDIAAPDGSSTVFKITAGHSGLGYNTWGDTAVSTTATTKTLSVYAAAGASSYISFDLYDTDDHWVTFNLSGTGSVTQTSGFTCSITRVGAGPWYLLSATWTPTTTTQSPILALAGSGTQPTDLTGVTVYVTRPKYENGAAVTGQPTSF